VSTIRLKKVEFMVSFVNGMSGQYSKLEISHIPIYSFED